jgi:hypothetical protein
MKFGFVLPSGSAREAADCAALAEIHGWDGFFVWEAVWGIDAWVSLTAAAMVTKHIRIGTMLSPIPVLSPWKLASESATLDNLSNGRVILSVGLGAVDTGFGSFGFPVDRSIRAERLDEGLDILTGLWGGQPFEYQGKHYQIKPNVFIKSPELIQKPRIPIWVVGAWPSIKSMRRVLKYNGILPNFLGPAGKVKMDKPELAEIREMVQFIRTEIEQGKSFDIVMEGETNPAKPDSYELVREYQDAGANWWIEACWNAFDLTQIKERIIAGPPKHYGDMPG